MADIKMVRVSKSISSQLYIYFLDEFKIQQNLVQLWYKCFAKSADTNNRQQNQRIQTFTVNYLPNAIPRVTIGVGIPIG